jgi:hypothetical protein
MARWDREDTDVWKIAMGVALGILVAGLIGFAVRAWFAHQAISEFTEQTNRMLIRQQQAAQAALARSRAEEAERQRLADERAAAKRAEKNAILDEQARRERAWAKYYTKPARCDDQPSDETLVQCANEHIRAKRRFDAEYAAGRL